MSALSNIGDLLERTTSSDRLPAGDLDPSRAVHSLSLRRIPITALQRNTDHLLLLPAYGLDRGDDE